MSTDLTPGEPTSPDTTGFAHFRLAETVLQTIRELGYEVPYPIQEMAIPPLLEGRDLLGQAQTGTGKTAAFALPVLTRLDLARKEPQALVLTPTRELAIQVAEAMQTYARHMPGFHVLPIYGGQAIESQLHKLRRGVHVVVGTPGRLLDHLRRKTLKLDTLMTVVIDEADEMLRMGFMEDVKAILDQTPAEKQVALFSATFPEAISRIARRYLRNPVEARIATATSTVASTTQRYFQVSGGHKLDALTRILEAEEFDAMLVFVRTRVATDELAEKLEARGFSAAALSGDMTQGQREKTIERLKNGGLDIVVATDVAARGLDVDRVSHVINYDIPFDTEAYIHRIGRTGRAGRKGQAILFIAPREQRMLAAIERATRQPIARMTMPSKDDITDRRVARFKTRLTEVLGTQDLAFFKEIVLAYQREQGTDLEDLAAALTYLVQHQRPLQSQAPELRPERSFKDDARHAETLRRAPSTSRARPATAPDRERPARPVRERPERVVREAAPRPRAVHAPDAEPGFQRPPRGDAAPTRPDKHSTADTSAALPTERGDLRAPRSADTAVGQATERGTTRPRGNAAPARPEAGESGRGEGRPLRESRGGASARPTIDDPPLAEMERYRLEVGSAHGVEVRNIVGAIANEAELDSKYIGPIRLYDTFTIVDLPAGMPRELYKHLRKVWVGGRQLQIRLLAEAGLDPTEAAARLPRTHAPKPKPRGAKRPAARPAHRKTTR